MAEGQLNSKAARRGGPKKAYDGETLDAIKTGIDAGDGYKQIARRLSMDEKQIRIICNRYGWESRYARRNREYAADIEAGLRLCLTCDIKHPIEAFYGSHRGRPHSYCRTCFAKRYGVKVGEIEWRFHRMVYASRRTAKNKNLPFSITEEDLIRLWEEQGGRCAYTGVQMTSEAKHPHTLSIDKVVPALGYVPSNIVLCCDYVNWMKADKPTAVFLDWCAKITAFHAENQQSADANVLAA